MHSSEILVFVIHQWTLAPPLLLRHQQCHLPLHPPEASGPGSHQTALTGPAPLSSPRPRWPPGIVAVKVVLLIALGHHLQQGGGGLLK